MPETNAKSLPYKRLTQRHPSYKPERIALVNALYEGGFAVTDRAKDILRVQVGENQERFDYRARIASYAPYYGQIVDGFVSDLFNQSLSIRPVNESKEPGADPYAGADEEFWKDFSEDADGEGKSFLDLMAEAVTSAMNHRRGIVAIDSPRGAAANKLEAKERGLDKLYAYVLPVEQVIDWKMTKRNSRRYQWLIRWEKEQERESPTGDRTKIRETFTLWTIGDAPGSKASWEKYEIEYPQDKPPQDDTLVHLADSEVTAFDVIPFSVRDLPLGLWVGNKIAGQQLEHYNRRAALVGAMAVSMVAIPYIARGTEVGSPGGVVPSETQSQEDRGANPVGQFQKRGWVPIGAGDKLDFAEPEGKCYDLTDKVLDDLRKDMFAVNFQMAASVRPSPGSMARSGKSKEKDGEATAKVLRKLGSEVREWAVDVHEIVAAARGGGEEELKWTAHGMDVFESDSREEVLEESISMSEVDVPSPTFRKAHRKKVARQLLENADPETYAQIDAEIEEATDDEFERDAEREQLEHEATTANLEASAENPPAAQVKAPQVPPVKQPKVAAPKPKVGQQPKKS